MTHIRPATAADLPALLPLRGALWDAMRAKDHAAELAWLTAAAPPPSTLPLAVFVAEAADGTVIAFIEVGLRSHAEACDARRPVGYIEGWHVAPPHQGRGLGRALMATAEAWAREQGAAELASDTWIDHDEAHAAHLALGFAEVDRCIHYRKPLTPPEG